MKGFLVLICVFCLGCVIAASVPEKPTPIAWSFTDWLWGNDEEPQQGYNYKVEYVSPQGRVMNSWSQHTQHRASTATFRDGRSQLNWRTDNYGRVRSIVSEPGYTFRVQRQ